MSELNDVIGGNTITASFTNEVKERSLMRYADAAARDTSIPAPVAGSLAWLEDVDKITAYDGTVWRTVAYEDLVLLLTGGTLSGPIISPPEASVHFLDNGLEQVWYTKSAGMITVSVKSTLTFNSVVATLPAGVRPSGGDVDFFFTVYENASTARVDRWAACQIRANGQIVIAALEGVTPGVDQWRGVTTYAIGGTV